VKKQRAQPLTIQVGEFADDEELWKYWTNLQLLNVACYQHKQLLALNPRVQDQAMLLLLDSGLIVLSVHLLFSVSNCPHTRTDGFPSITAARGSP
jgi:hypothetical protein